MGRSTMLPSRGKLAALVAFAVCAGVVTAGVPHAWRFVLESWRLRQLESGGLAERRAAVVALGEMRSERAAPRLLELARTDGELGPLAVLALVRIGESPRSGLLAALRTRDLSFWRRTAAALTGIGPEHPAAVPVLLELALRGPKEYENEPVLWQAVEGLKRCGPDCVRFLTWTDTASSRTQSRWTITAGNTPNSRIPVFSASGHRRGHSSATLVGPAGCGKRPARQPSPKSENAWPRQR